MDEINEFGGMTGSPMGGLFSGGGLVPNPFNRWAPQAWHWWYRQGFSGGGPVPKSTSNSKNGEKISAKKIALLVFYLAVDQ